MDDEIHTSTGAVDGDLGEIIESARAVVAEQFQIAERLDRKARYQVGSAGAFFAVVQAVAVNAITSNGLSGEWPTTLAIIAVPAALITVGAFLAAAEAWRTQPEGDLPLEKVRSMIGPGTPEQHRKDREWLANLYLTLAQTRRDGNALRLQNVKRTTAAALISVALTGLELVLIFVALAHG